MVTIEGTTLTSRSIMIVWLIKLIRVKNQAYTQKNLFKKSTYKIKNYNNGNRPFKTTYR